MKPDVSVIMAAYNSMPYITTAIESLFAQTIGVDALEIIAVDDGSTDGTGEELDRLATLCPSLRVLHQPNSGGPASPRNVALDLACGRYVFILDADDYLGEEALARMVAVADEHGTDVVVGRMVSVGGRPVPKRMFRTNQLSTDVITSDAFWTVNPTKLFRRELIERLGLRFDEAMILGEDQPFVATAYFNATGISILADYDYVYWVHRDDGQNLTKTILDLEPTLPSLERMLAILAENVPPGPDRDRLASRLFEYEMMNTTLARVPLQPDSASRYAGLDAVRSWITRYYTPDVARRLPPYHVLCYHLIRCGLYDDALEMLRSPDQRVALITRDGRAYLSLPCPENGCAGAPTLCDVTDQLRYPLRFSEIRWALGVLRLRFGVAVEGFSAEELSASLLLRDRTDGEPIVLSTMRVSAQEGTHGADECACFSADIDFALIHAGEPLPFGRWDLRLEIGAREMRREVKLVDEGLMASSDRLTAGFCLVEGWPARVVTPYLTENVRALAFRVTEPSRTLKPYARFKATRLGPRPHTLVLSGHVTAANLPRDALELRLEGVRPLAIPLQTVETEQGAEFHAIVDAQDLASDGHLNDSWTLSLRAETSTLCLDVAVPYDGSRVSTWWRGLRRIQFSTRATQRGALRVGIRSLSLSELLAAKLTRASRRA